MNSRETRYNRGIVLPHFHTSYRCQLCIIGSGVGMVRFISSSHINYVIAINDVVPRIAHQVWFNISSTHAKNNQRNFHSSNSAILHKSRYSSKISTDCKKVGSASPDKLKWAIKSGVPPRMFRKWANISSSICMVDSCSFNFGRRHVCLHCFRLEDLKVNELHHTIQDCYRDQLTHQERTHFSPHSSNLRQVFDLLNVEQITLQFVSWWSTVIYAFLPMSFG